MPLAGETLQAGRVPGERIGTFESESDSSGFTTTETVIATVTVPLVAGRTYKISFYSLIRTTVAGDDITTRIREDSSAGTERALRQDDIFHAGSTGIHTDLETEYTAAATGDKTIVATCVRATGTGTITARGAVGAPRRLHVEYVEG